MTMQPKILVIDGTEKLRMGKQNRRRYLVRVDEHEFTLSYVSLMMLTALATHRNNGHDDLRVLPRSYDDPVSRWGRGRRVRGSGRGLRESRRDRDFRWQRGRRLDGSDGRRWVSRLPGHPGRRHDAGAGDVQPAGDGRASFAFVPLGHGAGEHIRCRLPKCPAGLHAGSHGDRPMGVL